MFGNARSPGFFFCPPMTSPTQTTALRNAVGRRSLPRKLAERLRPAWARLHALLTPRLDLAALDPVLVLGNQKTGSTAIARLLAAYGRLGIAADVPPAHTREQALVEGALPMSDFLQQARYYFRHAVVKENMLTLPAGALLEALPQARFVYVVRRAGENIRSILDRLGLPGRPLPFHALPAVPEGWRSVVDGRWLFPDARNHIAALAARWTRTARLYQQHRARLTLVRYEDFTADKERTIARLAEHLGIPQRQDIRSLLDVPFQPRGAHRRVAPADFFSPEALRIIRHRCTDAMQALGYDEPLPAPPAA